MEEIKYKRWTLSFDIAANREAYRRFEIGGPEGCGCTLCLNFVQAREQIYPAEVRALFAKMGIDYGKEVRVYHLTRLDSGLHLYGGFLNFVGHIKSGRNSKVPVGEGVSRLDFEEVSEHFSIAFTEDVDLVPVPFQGKPLVKVEFLAEVPWVHDSEEPE